MPDLDAREPGWYTLVSGRQVWFQRLHVRRSSLGIMLGGPEQAREEVLGRLRADVKRLFSPETGILLRPPPGGPLPRYLFMAEYLSHEPVNRDYHFSDLVVCWFSDDVTVDQRMLEAHVQAVDWDSVATDGYW